MGRGQNETSWLKHQTFYEIQSTEVFVSRFNTLCTFNIKISVTFLFYEGADDTYWDKAILTYRQTQINTDSDIIIRYSGYWWRFPELNPQMHTCSPVLSVYILMSFDFPFLRLFGVR
jgi:hypothetical protein